MARVFWKLVMLSTRVENGICQPASVSSQARLGASAEVAGLPSFGW